MSPRPAETSHPETPTYEAIQEVSGPRRFGRYQLCLELASGGMGTIYLALAEGPGRFEKLIALKRIHPHLAKNPKFLAMFWDEARIAARIHHPNVCSVLDFGEVDGGYYLTMPFLMGESLHRVYRKVSRDKALLRDFIPVAVRLVADACEGLHAAHELTDETGEPQQVVHRDVTPHNLLVGYDGVLRVLDFGVASARHRLYSTATGEVKGKFAYISPEQLESLPVDRRADIWSLGVLLWEAIAGERLFSRGEMGATVRAVLNDPIPELRELNSETPLGLEEIVFKALARDREQRFATAREMGRELNAFLAEDGRVVGAAEVAEFMERVFPLGLERKRALVEWAKSSAELDLAPTKEIRLDGEIDESATTDRATRRTTRGIRFAIGVAILATLLIGGPLWLGLFRGGGLITMGVDNPTSGSPPATVTGTERLGDPEAAVVATDPTPSHSADAGPPDSGRPDPDAGPDPAADAVARVNPRRPRPRPNRARGRIQVMTRGFSGWAYLGRRQVGEVPGPLTLPVGRHTLTIRPLGDHPSFRARVTVPADGIGRETIVMP